MRSRLWLALLLLPPAALAAAPADKAADKGAAAADISWKKIVVDRKFRSEGVAIADVNKDGKMDVVTGEWWFEAPDWKPHAIRKNSKEDYTQGDKNVYGNSFCCWIEDFNGDGWPDVLCVGFPGQPCHWYENPKGQDGVWAEHLVNTSACNETPQYQDLFGTGKRVLVMGYNDKEMVWLEPDKDVTKPWVMHPISDPSKPGAGSGHFTHGLGIGDMNGDKRADVIVADGWYEQPAQGAAATGPWTFHPAKISEPCADMYAYDMDGDGKADVLSSSAHSYGIWWGQQRADGSFLKHDLFPQLVSETHAMHFVDINGDGLKDLVTGKRWWSHGRSERGSDKPAMIYWFEAKRGKDGVTTFTPHEIDNDSGVGTQFVVADFNGDGLPDVVTSNKKGTYIFLQQRAKN